MITAKDKASIAVYLKGTNIDEKEFYEELFDHIYSSYENRTDPNQSVKEHIAKVVEPAFGGKKGIGEVAHLQAKTRRRLVHKRALYLTGSYFFKWPTVLITALITLLLFQVSRFFEATVVFETSTTIGLMVPYLLAYYGKWRFKRSCKQSNAPYSSSAVNNSIIALSTIGVAIVYGVSAILKRALNLTEGFFEFFAKYPGVYIPVSMLLIVYSLVCLQLFKEKFQLKLT